jgi:signal-transduction protein with cAMP-binding, CBS, and nucleotidyltransferase domain
MTIRRDGQQVGEHRCCNDESAEHDAKYTVTENFFNVRAAIVTGHDMKHRVCGYATPKEHNTNVSCCIKYKLMSSDRNTFLFTVVSGLQATRT